MRSEKLVDLEIDRIKHRTEKAILITKDGKDVWLPKSQIEINDDDTITLPEWLAIEKELV